ncbi:hypothetical protein [Amorphus coralli]|uniref:hypothetical protein n=1 Tax=Amorphus coralli TaxID=340680 RepID=UPI0003677788|nr:hypothetical protein [Amorphus coralli]
MPTLRKWTSDAGETTAYLRLGAYVATEETLEPKQYSGDFSDSDGLMMATTGDLYLDADQAINVEIKGDLAVKIGTFSSDTDKDLRIDVLEGSATEHTSYNRYGSYTYTTYSGESGTFKGDSVAFNAVTDASTAKTAESGELMLHASDKIIINSGGMSKFVAGGDVKVTNKSESTYGSNKLQFNLGFVNSIVFGMQAKIVAGLYMSAMVGLRTQIRPLDWKISGNDFAYCFGKNEMVLFKQDNEGFGAFLIGCFSIAGSIFQKKSFARQTQKTLGNESKGSKLGMKLAGIKSNTVASNTGIANNM